MVWEEKNEYVKRQHYVPKFSIRPFEIKKGICLIAEWSLVLLPLVAFKGSAALSLTENGVL